MSLVMSMHWPEITVVQYEAVRKDVNWEGRTPAGAQFHVAWFGGDGLRVLDLWQSQAQFDQFAQTRLIPATMRLGVSSQPTVAFAPAHAIFAPNVPGARRAAAPKPTKPAARKASKKAKTKKAPARKPAAKKRKR